MTRSAIVVVRARAVVPRTCCGADCYTQFPVARQVWPVGYACYSGRIG